MAPIDRRAFGRLLSTLDAPALERFVADLYSARGFDVRIEDGAVVAERDGTGRTLIVRRPGGSPPDREADALVTATADERARRAARERDADLIGPGDLHGMVLYAIDRGAADALVRRHFGAGLEAASEAAPDRRPVARPRVALAALGLTLAVVLAAVGGGSLFAAVPFAGPAPGPTATPASGSATAGTATATPATVGFATPTPSPTPASTTPLVRCERSPRDALDAQLAALGTDEPGTNQSLRTVWRFGSPQFRWSVGGYDAFLRLFGTHPFEHLLGYEAVEYGDVTRTDDTVTRTLHVTGTDGNRYDFAITLVRRSSGERAGCWLVGGLTYYRPSENAGYETTTSGASGA